MPGMNAVGTNTESSTRVIAMIGAVTCDIAFSAASAGVSCGSVSRICSTASTTTIASSTTMPIARTSASSEIVLAEKPERQHHREGADKGDRHRDDRDQGSAQISEKDEDDDADEHKGFEQCLLDLVDHRIDEDCRVVHHVIGDVLGQAGLDLLQRLSDAGGDGDRIGPGRLVDRDRLARLPIVSGQGVGRSSSRARRGRYP